MGAERIIGHLSQIPKGEGRNFRVGTLDLAVFHTRAGEIFATQPRCPHLNGPLADGLTGNGTVTCPLHDRVFDLRTGAGLNDGDCIRTYPVRVTEDGRIVLVEGG